MKQSIQGPWNKMAQPRPPFLATMNFHDLAKLTNDPVSHDPIWLVVPAKLPPNIPKFEGKNGEDIGENVTIFHLWCSSNLLNRDFIRLWLFQRTLMGPVEKWYIQLSGGTYRTFNDLNITFLNHFQLPVHYDASIELLSTFRQEKAMHISYHIQEWHR